MLRTRYYMIFIYVFIIIAMSGECSFSFFGTQFKIKVPFVSFVNTEVVNTTTEDKKVLQYSEANESFGSLERAQNVSNISYAGFILAPTDIVDLAGVPECLLMAMRYALFKLFTFVSVGVLTGSLVISITTFFMNYTIKYVIIMAWFSTICVSASAFEVFELVYQSECTGTLASFDFFTSIKFSKSKFIFHGVCVAASLLASTLSLYL
ncbi:unnamed protein product [Phytomonas sp. EM1]|nr:unnamed protein product [Phytomonas sp. EM1]|eukprot:CCW61201.1 unnamed protein product [Phytomonas sp. isolate EM1]